MFIWLIWVNKKFVTNFNNWIDRITTPKEKKVKENKRSKTSNVDKVTLEGGLNNEVIDLDTILPNEEFDNDILKLQDEPDDEPKTEFEVIPQLNSLEILSAPSEPVTQNTDNIEPPKIEVVKEEDDFINQYTEDELNTLFDPRLDLSSYQADRKSVV